MVLRTRAFLFVSLCASEKLKMAIPALGNLEPFGCTVNLLPNKWSELRDLIFRLICSSSMASTSVTNLGNFIYVL